jgi:hypothetical protein
MSDTNPLGGKNPHSLYVPMSDTEQEVLERLVEKDDLMVVVHGWGIVHKLQVTFGDLRLTLVLHLDFDKPEPPGQAVHWFDLELKTRAGMSLYGPDRLPTVCNGKPLVVAAGMVVDMAWDIAIQSIPPEIVKIIKPHAIGLTSAEGNRNLRGKKAKLFEMVREGEAKVREASKEDVAKVEAMATGKPKR